MYENKYARVGSSAFKLARNSGCESTNAIDTMAESFQVGVNKNPKISQRNRVKSAMISRNQSVDSIVRFDSQLVKELENLSKKHNKSMAKLSSKNLKRKRIKKQNRNKLRYAYL